MNYILKRIKEKTECLYNVTGTTLVENNYN